MGKWESYTVRGDRGVLNYESSKQFIVLTQEGRRWKWTLAAALTIWTLLTLLRSLIILLFFQLANSKDDARKRKTTGRNIVSWHAYPRVAIRMRNNSDVRIFTSWPESCTVDCIAACSYPNIKIALARIRLLRNFVVSNGLWLCGKVRYFSGWE